MTEPKNPPAWCQHPVILGLASGAAFLLAITFFVVTTPPAWAISIPVGNLFVINIDNWAPLLTPIVALVIWWDTRQAKKNSAEAVKTAAVGVAKIEAVAHQMDGLLADRDKAKVAEGEKKQEKVGEEKAGQLAEGVRQGIAQERASVAAANPMPQAAADGKKPLPVADDRTATAAERSATALERTAEATEEKQKL